MAVATKCVFTRREVSLHDSSTDCWIIVHDKVYDVTQWLRKHPGGEDIILHHAGEDVTIPFEMLHFNRGANVKCYLTQYCIGELVESEKPLQNIEKDFLDLRDRLAQKGLFEANLNYFLIQFLIGILFEAISIALLLVFNNTWIVWTIAILCLFLATATMQGLGHDLGHHCAFKSTFANYLAQNISYTFFGGISSYYWNKHHNEHHAKTNVQTKDPDVSYKPYFFLIGSYYPKEMGRNRQGILPYQYQGLYLPIAAFTSFVIVYLNFRAFVVIYRNITKRWKEGVWFASFYIRWYLLYSSLFGGLWGAIGSYLIVKALHGTWYVMVGRTHHDSLPIGIHDEKQDWVTLQVEHTCNLKSTWFSDVFTTHTNYQIEHHLFPSMPPHNHHLAQSYVKELCFKYGLHYHERSLWEALAGVPRELNRCGREWYQEYTKASSAKND